MPGTFISYSRKDEEYAKKVEAQLKTKEVSVWRDKKSIYAGEQWPKAIGEGIANFDLFLLLWSKNSASSHFVEFEWNTAIALKKNVVPIFLDSSKLPPALSSINSLSLQDFEATISTILEQLNRPISKDQSLQATVIKKLGEIKDRSPKKVLAAAKAIFQQQGWVVHGDVYQITGSEINITNQQTALPPKKWWQRWQVQVIAALTILTLIFDLPKKFNEFREEVNGEHLVTESLKGIVVGSKGEAVDGAVVKLDLLPGDSVVTNSDGTFKFENVPGKVDSDVRIFVYATNYKNRNEITVIPGPIKIELERK